MYDRIASKIDQIASSLESRGFVREAKELDIVSNTLEAYAIDPRAPQARKANYEFIKKLKRRADDPQMNEPIYLPNGLVFSIQASQKHNCTPQKDLPNPEDYEAYEVAVGFKGKQLRDWLEVPGFEHSGSMGRFLRNTYTNVPAAEVEKMFQTAKKLGPNEVKAMVQRAQQQRAAWDKQEETEQAEFESQYGTSSAAGERKYSNLKYACAGTLDEIAGRLESKGLLREAKELDVVSNTLDRFASSTEVQQAWETTKELAPEHAKTLVGERPAGSKWGENLTEQKLVSLPWKKYTGPQIPGVMIPVAEYYYIEEADKHFPNAKQRMETLDEAEKKGYDLQVRKGAHGDYEIVSPQVQPSGISEAWLIIGPAEDAEGKAVPGKKMIWTLYPGKLTGSNRGWDGKLENIPEERKPHITVKAP